MYTPPFEITSKIIELISNISEKIGEINSLQDSPYHVKLRKENQKEYYSVLGVSDSAANSTKFIEFMLTLILNTIEKLLKQKIRLLKRLL